MPPGGKGCLKGTFIFKIKLRFQLLFVPVGSFTSTIKHHLDFRAFSVFCSLLAITGVFLGTCSRLRGFQKVPLSSPETRIAGKRETHGRKNRTFFGYSFEVMVFTSRCGCTWSQTWKTIKKKKKKTQKKKDVYPKCANYLWYMGCMTLPRCAKIKSLNLGKGDQVKRSFKEACSLKLPTALGNMRSSNHF